MAGPRERPQAEIPRWEPEPLYIPVHEPSRTQHRVPRKRDPSHDRRDRPGSTVIIIDLAGS